MCAHWFYLLKKALHDFNCTNTRQPLGAECRDGMRVVLYTQDFEPITVLDLPMWALEMVSERRMVRLAVMPKFEFHMPADQTINTDDLKIVEIRSEWLVWKDGSKKQILTTNQDESALLLKPSWLPGQQSDINDYKRDIRGLASLLANVLGSQA